MTIVKYTNKKTGTVSLYESTSHYDPVTKQSRPVRKYLGLQDPVTGELIPSSKQRGRKKGEDSQSAETESATINRITERYEAKIADLEKLVSEQKSTIKKLEAEKVSLVKKLTDLLNEITEN